MKSYFRYRNEMHINSFSDFHLFCTHKEFGIPAWKEHINSWLTGPNVGNRLHLVRYEDLCKDAEQEITLISQNFGWNLDRAAIRKAVAQSSMKLMKESEENYRKRNPRYTMQFVGGSSTIMVEHKTMRYIEESCSTELELLGYRPPHET